jgi:rhodanese-related sulfurtransferase
MKTTNKNSANKAIFPFMKTLVLALLALLLLACEEDAFEYNNVDVFVEEALENVEGITVREAREVFDTASYFLLLDVREPGEYKPGYIPDAINLPRGLVEFKIQSEGFWENKMRYLPEKSDLILVYCKKGKRAILAANTLRKMGFENVKYIIGGFKKWELTYPNDYQFIPEETHGHVVEEEGGC